MSASVIRADALRLPLPDQCVDLIVTSPPYFALRSYQDDDGHYDGQIGSEATPADFLVALWRVLDECWRVLKPSGSCWVNLGDKYCGYSGANWGHGRDLGGKERGESRVPITGPVSAPSVYGVRAKSVMGLPWRFALGASSPEYRWLYEPNPPDCWHDEQPCSACRRASHPQWINRRPLIWQKMNGLPESVTDRTRANFEDWFMLTKQGRYFSAVDEIREPSTPQTGLAGTFKRANGSHDLVPGQAATQHRDDRPDVPAYNPLGKLPGSVWTIPSEPLIVPEAVQRHYGLPDHFAAFPQEWPRRIILGFSPSGICTACGEGRRPVVEKEATGHERTDLGGGGRGRPDSPRAEIPGRTTINRTPWAEGVERTVTGHACACPTPDAPTRPPLVIDPFGGTGTVAGVANALGRHGLSFDLSGSYCRLARWRIRESGHFAKTHSRTDRERQGVMFAET